MKTWRYLVIGGTTLAWAAGCADLPSFPENFMVGGTGGMTSGGSSVIPMAGSTAMTGGSGGTTSTAGSTAGGTPSMGGMATGGGGMATGGMSGGDTMTAGTGGMMTDPQAEIDDAVKNLKGWRYENACGYVDGHSLTDGTCNSGEICWKDSTKARFKESKVIDIGGVAGHQYDVTLRIRGAIEPRDYPADCMRLANDAANTIGIAENCDGYANTSTVSFNIFEFKIESPAHVYYLNSVPVHPPHRVDPIDQNWTIRVAGGSKIDFNFDDVNGGEIRNCSITVEGIAPYPNIYDGNFFQLDVVDAKLVQ